LGQMADALPWRLTNFVAGHATIDMTMRYMPVGQKRTLSERWMSAAMWHKRDGEAEKLLQNPHLSQCPGQDSNPRRAMENLLQDERLSPIACFDSVRCPLPDW